MTDALPGGLHFACATRVSIAAAQKKQATDQDRLRQAQAILGEVAADPRVPNALRKLASMWCNERQDAARASRQAEAPRG
jgi:uncharacterized protein (UPF0147 family)